jgi:AAA ATPase domain
MFCGRSDEFMGTERALFQTKNGNPHHFLIYGERGIGKSSLLFSLDLVARGKLDALEGGKFKFLTLNIELEPGNTYSDLIGKVGAELRRVVAIRQPGTEIAKATWDFLRRWEVMGVKYSEGQRQAKPNELLEELTHTFDQTISRFGSDIDGILLLIDEADKPPNANLGEFVKLFTERLTKRGCNNVCLGLAGLSNLLDHLRQSHESSTRIFQIFKLEPLLPRERVEVVQKGLAQANARNAADTSIDEDAKDAISDLSEGYPHFVQQFAYCAFEEDTDDNIDLGDVMRGAFHPGKGAITQLGLKYFHELYFDQIGSDEYRDVLRTMAENFDGWVSKTDLKRKLEMKQSTLNNAISALKRRHIILPKPGNPGIYRLPTKSFAVWIRAFTKAPHETPAGQSNS